MENTWQSIESAPKNAVNVLITDGEDMTVAAYIYGDSMSSSCSPHIIRDITKRENWFLAETGAYAEDNEPSFNPTHWMPLPEKPLKTLTT